MLRAAGLVYHHQSAALAWPDFMVLYYTVLTAAIDPSIYTSRWGVSGAAVAGALGGCQAYQRYPLAVELASPPVAFVAVSMLLLLAASLLITDLATLQAPASTHLLLLQLLLPPFALGLRTDDLHRLGFVLRLRERFKRFERGHVAALCWLLPG